MIVLGKQDAKKRRIVSVCDKDRVYPLFLAAMHRTNAASIKRLAREDQGQLHSSLHYALEFNEKSTAIVSLLHKCLTALEMFDFPALIDLCGGESHVLLVHKEYMERHPVHHAAMNTTSIAVLKPLIHEQAPELLVKDTNGSTPLDYANTFNPNPAVVSFESEVDTAFRDGNFPALIKFCGSTPDWTIRATLAKDKKDKADRAEADRLEAAFFDWDENGIKENSASQPTPPTTKKKHKKKRKTAAEKAAEVEAAQAIRLAEIRAVLAAAEPYAPTPAATEEELETAVQALE